MGLSLTASDSVAVLYLVRDLVKLPLRLFHLRDYALRSSTW